MKLQLDARAPLIPLAPVVVVVVEFENKLNPYKNGREFISSVWKY